MSALEPPLDEENLRRRMREVCALRPEMRLTVGVALGDQQICLQGVGSEVTRADEVSLACGCLTKLLTGAIAMETLQRQRLSQDVWVADCLGLGESFGPVQLRHLLDHTHGWDTSTTNELRLRLDGCVDVASLYGQLREAGRIAPPGGMHFYANASAWLATALAERIAGEPMAELLTHRVFSREEISQAAWCLRRDLSAGAICGATGRGMEVSGAALLAFLKSFWRGHRRGAVLSGPPAEISALPGWSGPEQGIIWGWKWHGDGWYGHSSSTAGAYGLVRVQPVQQIAIFVCSRQQNCTPPATALFGRWFNSFAPVRGPRLLPVDAEIDFDAYVGIYDIAATRVVVGRAQDGLSMQAYRRERGAVAKEPFHVARLRPASEHVFYPEPMHAELFPYLQFIGPACRRYSYIWNGKGLWLRR